MSLIFCAAIASLTLVAAAPASRFTLYDVPTPLAGPCDLWDGPDGAIWADTFLANKVIRIDPKSGNVSEYDIPYTNPVLPNSVLPSDAQGRVALACVVQPYGEHMYLATGIRDQIARINVNTKKVEVFGPINPLGNLEPFNDAWPGPTGMFFSHTTGNTITLFDDATTEMKTFPLPKPLSGPLGMRTAADGALWFTDFLGNRIGRLNYTDGTIIEYDCPPSLLGPSVMRVQTDDRYLWFDALLANALGRIDITTGEMTAFPITNGALLPFEITSDSQDNIWFSSPTADTLNYFTPSTGKFTTIYEPGSVSGLPVGVPPFVNVAIHYVQADNSIWFTELTGNKIGKYRLS